MIYNREDSHIVLLVIDIPWNISSYPLISSKTWYIMIWNSWRCVHYYDILWLPRKKTKKSHTGDTHVATHTHMEIPLKIPNNYTASSISLSFTKYPHLQKIVASTVLWAYHSSHSSQHMKHLRTGGSSLAATQTGAWPCAALRWLRWRWRVGPHFPHGTHRAGKI